MIVTIERLKLSIRLRIVILLPIAVDENAVTWDCLFMMAFLMALSGLLEDVIVMSDNGETSNDCTKQTNGNDFLVVCSNYPFS